MKKKTPIAVVGMAGLFPGASDLDIFWNNIVNKVDSTCEVPRERWIVEPDAMYASEHTPDKAYSKRACLIHDFQFDPRGFGIDEELLQQLDPLHHIVLHVGNQAFLSCNTESLDKNRIGVALAAIALPTDSSSAITREIFGRTFEDRLFSKSGVRDSGIRITKEQYLSARVTSLPGSILASSLGLGLGSFTLDAACASSLYAVKLACDELHAGRADAMLAGGVSRPECLYTQVGFSQLRALSRSGRCAPFDESADGLVVGEGAGILVLKRLDDALWDRDTIHGLICGIGLSNDMRGNLLAPDTEGQVRAMRSAYEAASWSPHEADLIECHGAGTPVGDATELRSLRTLWGESGWSPAQCAIGSVKSMIGHLLTGAGAAGMIKTLLALKHKTLPPSLNFKQPSPGSPLNNSPFRVQTDPEEWKKRNPDRPRRAAVSAFGFGGINAHLLFETFEPRTPHPAPCALSPVPCHPPCAPVAIVGMETVFGSLTSLGAFQKAVFNGDSVIRKRPEYRWKGSDMVADKYLDGRGAYGGYMDDLSLHIGEFHIPPNEIPDILPQQLLMLKVAAKAMTDARLPLREERPRMGVIIGTDFDFEATNFHLRWHLYNKISEWKKRTDLDDSETLNWLESLRDAWNPPLTSARTLGALGGIVASRIAREFRFGGPSFIVSGEEASGLKALEIGVRSLQQNETDAVLVGAIDLAGDVRKIITSDAILPFAKTDEIRPFDPSAHGTLPGEGAVALVLKPLDQAKKDGDRIYAVIRGMGNAGGVRSPLSTATDNGQLTTDQYMLSLKRAISEADISPDTISYIETHGSGNPLEDGIESASLHEYFAHREAPCAIGSVKPNVGHTGAAAGLASVAKVGLCLYHEIIPPLRNSKLKAGRRRSENEDVSSAVSDIRAPFHLPAYPQFWLRNRKEGPRRACAVAMTTDGNFSHVILEEFDYGDAGQLPGIVRKERKRPAGAKSHGLFIVEGDTKNELMEGLRSLQQRVSDFPASGFELAARAWYLENRSDIRKKHAVSIVASDISQLGKWIKDAEAAVSSGTPRRISGPDGICYSPNPLGDSGETAYVFPGSGSHYVGMGRGMGLYWPEILRDMDARIPRLQTLMVPECYMPWRNSWNPGWEKEAQDKIASEPLNVIFGQVIYGEIAANLVKSFGIKPSAVIGYSIGESAGLFATGAWSAHEEMLKKMLSTELFSTELAGPCHAARKAWNIPGDESFDWCVAMVNRGPEIVQPAVDEWPFARLLIINTPDECVIGGKEEQVRAVIKALGCEAVFLQGIITVHCDAAVPVADAYRELHLFPVTPPRDIRFYSCAMGHSYELTSDSAAASILQQALSGFDFTAVIGQAYEDGVRIFLEMGPHASCTRMIDRILKDKPHLAISADVRGEDDYLTMLKFLGTLTAERIGVDLDKLYGDASYAPGIIEPKKEASGRKITVMIGGKPPSPVMPASSRPLAESKHNPAENKYNPPPSQALPGNAYKEALPPDKNEAEPPIPHSQAEPGNEGIAIFSELMGPMTKNIEATADAHNAFLDFSSELTRNFGKTFSLQAELLETSLTTGSVPETDKEQQATDNGQLTTDTPVAFDREMCMEFAIGSLGKVLGPEFAIVDTYNVRVRLPDEPLMLVDRIISVEGEKGSLTSGRVVTEHDVFPEAWYLDGDRAPVCISVEAGQADLFLCSYLGTDLAVKGKRTYRLLDATVRFHRGLPRPGDTIRYEIEIEKFIRQGETWMFFFKFDGFIRDEHLITMREGCAGFFTEEEIRNSGGIILTEEETEPLPGKKDFAQLVPLRAETYDDDALDALRVGDLSRCFGAPFSGVQLAESLRLPGGRMRLIDRVLLFDPEGGRYGLGLIRAQADIHPDDWFLTCHFMDDMVMPGTLMYECCAHTLRVFLQRIGWVTDKPGVCYEPVIGIPSILKCRGPVTQSTKHVIYEVEISEIGYSPEPYVIADAHMYGDGHRIVKFNDMSMKMTNVTRGEIESIWSTGKEQQLIATDNGQLTTDKKPLFNRNHILAFAIGKPSEAFGEPYKVFDNERTIARLPGPPYAFIDRIIYIEPEPWVLNPGGWVDGEYDVPPDAWYFRADRTASMPFCVILEIALQLCGWLAAYAGSALKSKNNLKFRNLGGNALLHRNILPDAGTLTMRSRMTKVSEAGDMIIENFDMQILQAGEIVYEGDTYFGFFTKDALAQQIGIRGAEKQAYIPSPDEMARGYSRGFEDEAPLSPDDPNTDPSPALAMPGKAIRMIDEIEVYIPDGGPAGLGFIRGIKKVDPGEWFFKAHFYQDPVCPGSLGIESFLQLLRFAAIERWKHLADTHRFEFITGKQHRWIYRGQVIQKNKKVEVEAVITGIQESPVPAIFADGYLKVDGLFIYQMEDFGVAAVPV
ncbi:beta-ketoacyl synthase N-terminal-like domain-containing protein [Desulfococcaceae bacterium HSG8]|nr:beta-ketoacyl synthase N-terminal-like domain-containing protein [Desulfococcaceae bacterium HSG8]